MPMDKKIIQKYFVDGKFRKKDHNKLALKATEALIGERDLSDFTTKASRYVVSGYQAQERNDNSIRGSADKKIEIIERTTTERLTRDLSESARNIFDSFPQAEPDKWRLRIEGDTLFVDYYGRDRIKSGQRTSWTLTFESFRTGYFTRIRKKLKESVE
jgi:hypothetical protein